LLSMMGVHEVCIDGNKIEIQYDLVQVTAEQIADQLALTGANLGSGWVDRLKMAFINYKEECEIGGLEVDNTKGCH
jgi:5,10-methylenetetrahydrofolate reductase